MVTKYDKFITAFVGFILVLVVRFFGSDSDAEFVVQAVIGLLTAIGVYTIPNKPAA